jgi:hypothetical protein
MVDTASANRPPALQQRGEFRAEPQASKRESFGKECAGGGVGGGTAEFRQSAAWPLDYLGSYPSSISPAFSALERRALGDARVGTK